MLVRVEDLNLVAGNKLIRDVQAYLRIFGQGESSLRVRADLHGRLLRTAENRFKDERVEGLTACGLRLRPESPPLSDQS